MIFKIIESNNTKFINSIWEEVENGFKCVSPCNTEYTKGFIVSKETLGEFKFKEYISLNE